MTFADAFRVRVGLGPGNRAIMLEDDNSGRAAKIGFWDWKRKQGGVELQGRASRYQ